VPLITVYFWIIKLLTTAMGEATSDYMVRTINPVIAVLFGFTAFVIAMILQFRAKRYVAWTYWLAVAMVAVFGTQAADVLHIKFHVPYAASTAFYAVVLTVIFIVWYRVERTLSIHSIRTPRRELFYWATVLAAVAVPARALRGVVGPSPAQGRGAPPPAGGILRLGRPIAHGARRTAGRLSEGPPTLRYLCPVTHSPASIPMSSRPTAAN